MKKPTKTLLLITAVVSLFGCGKNTTNSKNSTSPTGGNSVVSKTPAPDSTAKSDTSVKHTHSYTGDWKHNDTKHWKECDANDGEKSLEADHVYTDGGHTCSVCGYDMYANKGSFTGAVKLHKLGAYVTDYEGITITADEDNKNVVVTYNNDGTYSVTNCEVNKSIVLTFSKTGYQSITKTIMATDTEVVKLKDVTLEYERFVRDIKANWDADKMDYSHVNDDDPYLGFNYDSSGMTLIANTADVYDDVYATWTAKKNGISVCTQRNQGIYLLFPNAKKLAAIQLNGENYNFERMANFWGYNATQGDSIQYEKVFDGWGGYTLNDDEKAAYNSDTGLEIGTLRRGSHMYLVVNGVVKADLDLPEELATEQCKVGYYVFDCGNAETGKVEFHFDITSDLTGMEATITTTSNDNTLGTITNKDEHTLVGTKTDIEITPKDGYVVESITNNGVDVTSDYASGHLKTTASATNNIVVKFSVVTYGVLDTAFVGVEFDSLKKHQFTDGTKVTIENGDNTYEATMTNGKINVAKIEAGTYTAKLSDGDDYCTSDSFTIVANQTYSTDIEVSENALTSRLTSWKHDLDNSHIKDGYFSPDNDCWFVSTKKTYLKGAATVRFSKNFNGDSQGICARYKNDDGSYTYVSARDEKAGKIQFDKDAMNWHLGSAAGESESAASGWDWVDLMSYSDDTNNESWASNTQMTADELKTFAAACKTKRDNDTLEMTFVRDGSNVYLFVDGTYLATKSFDSSLADKEMEFCFFAAGSADGNGYHDVHASFTSDISAYLAVVNPTSVN